MKNLGCNSRLSDSKVSQHLLCSSEDRVELLRSLELLNRFPEAKKLVLSCRAVPANPKHLPRFGQTSTSKDIDGIIGNIPSESSRLHLEESDLSSQIPRLFLV
jgi:hypothetical protein